MTDISLQKTAKAARRGRARRFQKGQSGNPVGRPRGSTNRAARAAELLLDGEAEALTRKAIELALAGDTGDIVGSYCYLRDPNGHSVEFSLGQALE
jgi:hypothetical protein